MRQEWLIAGFGGQGVLFAGDLAARSAMAQGFFVTYMPTYGVAMRGGTANCVVKLSDEVIGSPLLEEPDAAILLNQQSFDKFQPMMKAGGVIVANSSIVDRNSFNRGKDLRVTWAPVTEIAKTVAGTDRATNMAAMGAFIAAIGMPNFDIAVRILGEHSSEGGKKALLEKNIQAMRAGMDAVRD
jgi:2-oxoglutarate ferredoxin oxidoreductase subunit gamma